MDQSSSLKLPRFRLARTISTRQFTVEVRFQAYDRLWRVDVLMRGRSLSTSTSAHFGHSLAMAVSQARQTLMWPRRTHYSSNRRLGVDLSRLDLTEPQPTRKEAIKWRRSRGTTGSSA